LGTERQRFIFLKGLCLGLCIHMSFISHDSLRAGHDSFTSVGHDSFTSVGHDSFTSVT